MSTQTPSLRPQRTRVSLRAAWQTLREAMAGTPRDYTAGSIGGNVVLLAIPMVLEMGLESVFAIVDIFFVARLGADAVATIGLTESVLTLLYAVAIGLSMGATALVARRIGEKDVDGARVAAMQVVWLGIGLAVLIGLAGVSRAADLLHAMGGNGDVVANGSRYTAVMFGGSVTILLLFLFNAIFRGAGNAVVAMRALWIASGINIVLDPCLIFGLGPFPELGVTGAAVATTIGRGAGVCYQLYCLGSGHTAIKVNFGHLRLRLAVMARLLRVSVPGAFQLVIAMSSYMFLMRIIAAYGSNAVAGFTIGIRIFAFTFLPAWGLSNAAATLVGQNLGAGLPDRAEKSVWIAAKYNALFLVSVAVIFIGFADELVGIFTQDPVVAGYAADCLRVCSYSYGFYAVGIIVTQAFNGAGDTDTPTLINLLCFWLIQIPLAYMLARVLMMGPEGVYVTIAVCDTLLAVISVIVFRRGRWKRRTV